MYSIFGLAEVLSPQITKKIGSNCKSAKCHICKLFKTPQLRLSDLRNLFAKHPTLKSTLVDKVYTSGAFFLWFYSFRPVEEKTTWNGFSYVFYIKMLKFICTRKNRVFFQNESYIQQIIEILWTYKVHDNYIFWSKVWYRSLCANILNYLLRGLLSTLIC